MLIVTGENPANYDPLWVVKCHNIGCLMIWQFDQGNNQLVVYVGDIEQYIYTLNSLVSLLEATIEKHILHMPKMRKNSNCRTAQTQPFLS